MRTSRRFRDSYWCSLAWSKATVSNTVIVSSNLTTFAKYTDDVVKCEFCEREYPPGRALASHVRYCSQNLNNVVGTSRNRNEAVFIENSSYDRRLLRKRILDYDLLPYRCACCGIGPYWNGAPMPLILDHENGVNNDNRLSNLRFVCSNCDSQLPTYKSKNRKKLEG